jgi:Holliday junction resolvase RusA-like endonuclease
VKLTIPNHRPISWNRLYTQRHWSKRKALADEAHLLTLAAIPGDVAPYNVPVDITVTAYNRKPLDADNIASKLYIDGLKGRLIEDDSPAYVHNVTTRSFKGDPRVEIEINELLHDADRGIDGA